jgi:dihydrofolate synthase/folylpolyglutamate synthase
MRVGLYTSPHLVDFRERFRVDGRPLDTEELLVVGRRVLAEHPKLTFFEVTTLIALEVFAEKEVDVAVLEVGLGGRLDAVNAVDADAVGITRIAMDHQEYLGTTLAAVAREKAEVMRAGRVVVWAQQCPEAAMVLERVAARVGAKVTSAHPALGRDPRWLGGAFSDNVAVARALASVMGAAQLGVDDFRWPARRDTFLDGFVLDVAHNPEGAASLVEFLGDSPPAEGILGLSRNKDAEGICAALAQLPTRWHLTAAGSPRAMPAAELARRAGVLTVESVTESVEDALGRVPAREERVLVTGSVYLMGDFLEAVGAPVEFFSLFGARA